VVDHVFGLDATAQATPGDTIVSNVRACRFTVLTVLAAVLTAAPARAGSQYQFVNFNGASDHANGTTANGINNNGAVVGFSTSPTGFLTNWIRNPDSTFTLLTPPLGGADMANGLNNANTVVGVTGANAFSLPFGGSMANLPAANPGNTGNELAFGINDKGSIVGQYVDNSTGTTPGFIYDGKNFTILNPVSPVGGVLVVNAQGINNNGIVTGFYSTDNTTTPVDGNEPQHGFLYNINTRTYTLVPDPTVPSGQTFFTVQLLGINDTGIVAGYVQDANGDQFGLLYNTNTKTYTYLNDPGAVSVNGIVTTQITGINNSGEITGFFVNSNGVAEGFVATQSVPEPSSVLLLGIGLTIGVGYAWRRGGKKTGV
jgi:Protein of unknown function (DUF3466)/PEP-CTERM motif